MWAPKRRGQTACAARAGRRPSEHHAFQVIRARSSRNARRHQATPCVSRRLVSRCACARVHVACATNDIDGPPALLVVAAEPRSRRPGTTLVVAGAPADRRLMAISRRAGGHARPATLPPYRVWRRDLNRAILLTPAPARGREGDVRRNRRWTMFRQFPVPRRCRALLACSSRHVARFRVRSARLCSAQAA